MESEATQPGAEIVQTESGSTGNDDAALLSAYLAEQEQGQQSEEIESPEPARQAEEEAPAAIDTFIVKIDGEEKQVTRDELITHYQKGEASNKRFEEAAAIRREVEQRAAQVAHEQAQLNEALTHYQQQLQGLMQQNQPDWQRLLNENPHEYLRQKELYEARQAQLQQAQAAQAYLQQQQEAALSEQRQAYLQQESAKLLEIIPEWKDQAKFQADSKAIIDYMINNGYSEQEIQNLNQSRAKNISLVRKAMLYDQLIQKASGANKKVSSLPPRVERPGVVNNDSGSGLLDAKNRLAKTGSIDDATAAFGALFG